MVSKLELLQKDECFNNVLKKVLRLHSEVECVYLDKMGEVEAIAQVNIPFG